jgi:hypothetical protein
VDPFILTVVEISRDSDDGLGDLLTELSFSDFLHLDKDHGRDFYTKKLENLSQEKNFLSKFFCSCLLTLGRVSLSLAFEFNLDEGVLVLVNDGERPVLHIFLDLRIIETTTDKTLSIENGVLGVHGSLVLSSITDKTFLVRESDVRRSGTVTLLVGNDFNTLGFPNTNTGVAIL